MKSILFSIFAIVFVNIGFGAEVFLRVMKTGTHYSTVYNQTQYNSTNIFRFFDLPGGNVSVQIIEQTTGTFIYNSSIYLNSNQRIVAELDLYGHLNIIQNSIIEYTNWYTLINNGNQSVGVINSNSTSSQSNSSYNQQMFDQFLLSLDKENFDSKKLDKAKKYINKGNLSVSQIVDIAKKFGFDSNRLDWTKYAYTKCSDQQNYFALKDTFTFSSNYDELEDYILNH